MNLPVELSNFSAALQRVEETTMTDGAVMFCKMVAKVGNWVFGSEESPIEGDDVFAVNPMSFATGFVWWPKDEKNDLTGAKPTDAMAMYNEPKILLGDLSRPSTYGEWVPQVSIQMTGVGGDLDGTVLEYKNSSWGTRYAVKALAQAIGAQMSVDPTKSIPLITLDSSTAKGKVGNYKKPVFNIMKWVGDDDAVDVVEELEFEEMEEEKPKRRSRKGA
jgi:hypothetical protein